MSKVLENNGYKMKVRNDRGDMLLIAQRVYTEQGVSYRGKPFYKGMVWYVYGWFGGRKISINGIADTMKNKNEVLQAIKVHPSFSMAASELGLSNV